MQTQIARAMFQVYEPIVLAAGGSNTPENQTICKQLGLGDHRMSYYATRSAPLGQVGAEIVSDLLSSQRGDGFTCDSACLEHREPGENRRSTF